MTLLAQFLLRLVQHPLTAWLVLFFSLLFTLLAFQVSKHAIDDKIQERFILQTQDIANAIKKRLLAYEIALNAGQGFMNASDGVTREGWRSFVAHLNISERFPGIQGLGYSEWIPPEQLDQHIAKMQKEFPDYQLKPAGQRDAYTSIVYLEPFDWRNQRAFGYDMFSEATRRSAMQRAIDTGTASVSGRVTLVQETERDIQYGFLMYLPIYKHGMPTETVTQRRKAIKGFVYAPFRVNDFMEGILRLDQQGIEINLYDEDGAPDDKPMYTSMPATPTLNEPNALSNADSLNKLEQKIVIPNQQRSWLLVTKAEPYFLQTENQSQPFIVAISGLIIDILLFVIIAALSRQKITLTNKNNELETLKNEALHANQAKSTFLAMISHEIRTPMHGVIASMELLLHSKLNQDQKQLVNTVQQSANNLLSLINNILDFSKIESGKIELTEQTFNLELLIKHLHTLLYPLAEQQSVHLHFAIAKNTPIWLKGDALRLQQIMTNLINNAIKFSSNNERPGKVEVSMILHQHLHLTYLLTITVSDNGIGMSKEVQSRLFKPFEQADSSTERRYGGTGLGLAICYDLVKLMGGDIHVHSIEQKGTAITVKLPFTLAEAPKETSENEGSVLKTHARKSSVNILIAEDDEISQEVIRRQMVQLGYPFTIVSNGKQALEAYQNQTYDLIITDLNMPEMGGNELARYIRHETQQHHRAYTPIVLLTANMQMREVDKAQLFDNYLTKPLSIKSLAEMIYQCLENQPISLSSTETTEIIEQDEKLIDLTALQSLIGNQKEDMLSFLSAFSKRLVDVVIQLETLRQEKDADQLQSLMHKLKSSARTLGATKLANECHTIEQGLIDKNSIDIDQTIIELTKNIQSVQAEVEQSIKRLNQA